MNKSAAITWTLADRLNDLGGISLTRIRSTPAPGQATVADLTVANDQGMGRYELIDATLVEKPMGWRESLIAAVLVEWIGQFVRKFNLGVVTGPDGFFRIVDSLARGPDVTYVSWQRLPNGRIPTDAIPSISPDLVIEILSKGNTHAEMSRKRREYFQAGVRQVWIIDPHERTAVIYTSIVAFTVLSENDRLDGGEVLPGLQISLTQLFAQLDRTAPEA